MVVPQEGQGKGDKEDRKDKENFSNSVLIGLPYNIGCRKLLAEMVTILDGIV
jgi:hypothetical protein